MTNDVIALSGNWNYPTTVRFGVGRIKELAKCCKNLRLNRPLLVTDPDLASLPMVANAITSNEEAGVPTGLFSDVRPNPLGCNVDDGLKVYRNGGHDGVIAFGGGSAMDAGKLIAFMSGQTKPLWDFEDVGDNWKGADPDGIAPTIAVPTTSGTGSEVGRAAVAAHDDTHAKKILFHPKMLPEIVICDPSLVAGLPPHITAGTGMDALAHCFEAYCAPTYHPMAEGIALEGMRLIKRWLPTAVQDGSNLDARTHMMAAAAMGATAFQKGLGAIHSLSHPVGSAYNTHHGLTNAVFMPYVMEFNRIAIEDKMGRLGRYLGLSVANYDGVMTWVLGLRNAFDIPHTAAELGVEESRLDELAEMAANDPTAPTNPVPAGAPEMKRMYEASMVGAIG